MTQRNTNTELPVVSTEHFDWIPNQKTLVGQISDFGPEFGRLWLGRVFNGAIGQITLKSHKTGDLAAFDLTMEEIRKTGVRAWRYKGRGPLADVKVTIYNS